MRGRLPKRGTKGLRECALKETTVEFWIQELIVRGNHFGMEGSI